MKKNKRSVVLVAGALCITMLSGCALLKNEAGKMKEKLKGRTAIVQTYDEESNIIDSIKGKSISISSEDKFAVKDKEGNTTKQSSVISLTINGKPCSTIAFLRSIDDVCGIYMSSVIEKFDKDKILEATLIKAIKKVEEYNMILSFVNSDESSLDIYNKIGFVHSHYRESENLDLR